jgi:hypothetical protein
MESGPSQYKSSTEQQRFARQLDRDLARKSGRLSQSTIRKLISNDTAQWAKSIYDQKLSQNSSNNTSAQQSSPIYATTQSGSAGISASGDTQISNDGSAGSSSGGGGGALPDDTEVLKISICVDGQPKEYWMFVVDGSKPEPVI